jgi:SAM-dependent methyltransferase
MKGDSRSVLARVLAGDVRAAERRHVQLMENAEGLPARPFLGGTSLDVDRALSEIAIFSAMVRCLPSGPGSLVLDLGAGPCWVSEWLQRLRYRTLSLDLAEDMLAIGRRRLAPGSWLCAADMAALPVKARSVDAALCYGALHHVPEWVDILGEVHRVLKDGGVLVLQEPGRGHATQAHSVAQMEQFGVLEQDLPPASSPAPACGPAFRGSPFAPWPCSPEGGAASCRPTRCGARRRGSSSTSGSSDSRPRSPNVS